MILDATGREANGNGVNLTDRQMKKQMALNATIGDVNEIAHAHAVQAANHLGNQVPALLHKVVSEAIQGYHAALVVMLRAKGIEIAVTNEPPTADVPASDVAPSESEGAES